MDFRALSYNHPRPQIGYPGGVVMGYAKMGTNISIFGCRWGSEGPIGGDSARPWVRSQKVSVSRPLLPRRCALMPATSNNPRRYSFGVFANRHRTRVTAIQLIVEPQQIFVVFGYTANDVVRHRKE